MNKYLTDKSIMCLIMAMNLYGCALHAATPVQIKSFAVYALSRGKGVPALTKETFAHIETLLMQKGNVSKNRIGIEGETKLCVTISDANQANELLQQVESMANGVELLNIVVESCKTQAE